uniref:Uncharacterized protein n=1 Tax=Candidatus Kentrum sp. LFY TaxID=2126342 RepID=A0A450WMB3_9GAMM|nr:MAG: hypothetical protein BECKLFY1418A_GA0070994_100550 [Candidatus Kentron sp. LFY]VFK18182.1 MAG: hypothetical protein BECKLFY1418C_GA0070996_103925 [Candidatus Kentron sp. LFY]
MLASRKSGFSPNMKSGYQRADLDEETTDLRSVHGEDRTHGSEGGTGKTVPIPIKKQEEPRKSHFS